MNKKNTGTYLLLSLCSIVILLPMIYMLSTSFKSISEILYRHIGKGIDFYSCCKCSQFCNRRLQNLHGCHTKCHRQCGLHNRNLSLTIIEAEKSKVKGPAG